MIYDNELILINQSDEQISVLCGIKSVSRTEFYNAAVAGLKPEIIFVVHGYEYSSEEKVKFGDNLYKIIKTYSVSFEEVELTCSMLRR